MAKRSLIIYGNCQAQAMASILAADPTVTSYFDVEYYRSFVHPVEPFEFRAGISERCALLWEQHDPRPFPERDRLPTDCMTIRFPAIDLSLLWPFNCVNPYNAPEPPVFPFGRFAYGDRVIVNAVKRGFNEAEILEYYLQGWDDYKVDLDRLLELERARITNRDANCDVKAGDFVLSAFARRRLFWTVNHPTPEMLVELLERLLAASDPVQPVLADADVTATIAQFGPFGPLGVVSVPVHPKVAEHFDLRWYAPDEKFRNWDGSTYTYREYFEEMIRHAFAMRAGEAVPTRPQ